MGFAVLNVLVDLVAEDQHVGEVLQGFGESRQLVAGIDRAGRVAGRTEDDEARALRDGAGELLGRDLEVGLDARADADGRGAGELDLRVVAHPVGREHDGLVAGVEHREAEIGDRLLGAVADDDLLGRVLQAVFALELPRDCLAEFDESVDGRVLREALVEGALGSLLDVVGGVEVGLPEAERDDVVALGGELAREAGHGERGALRHGEEPLGEVWAGWRDGGHVAKLAAT